MVVFHDVDGCLNTLDGERIGFSMEMLSSDQRSVLEALGSRLDRSNVTEFVVNTGRSWAATEYLCRTIGSARVRYALVEHGSELWDLATGTHIDLQTFAHDSGLATIAEALSGVTSVRTLMAWFENEGTEQLCDALGYDGPVGAQLDKRSNLTLPIPDGIDGDVMMASLENIVAAQPQFAAEAFVYHHSRGDRFVDVMGTMDKGLGVELVLRFLEEHRDNAVAVGNGLNDLPMLQAVGLPICPANAEPAVRAFCLDKGHVSPFAYIDATNAWLEGS